MRLLQDYSISLECFSSDWDGYQAKPLSVGSIKNASRFLSCLPKALYPDDVSPEPTGDLTMIWRDKTNHLIVGVDASGEIAWGGTVLLKSVHGQEQFDNKIPTDLTNLLNNIKVSRYALPSYIN